MAGPYPGKISWKPAASPLQSVSSVCSCRYRKEGGKGCLHVVERIVKTSLLGGLVNLVGRLLDPFRHGIIVLRTSPLDHLGVAQVDLARVETEGVTTALGRCAHPEVADGLPVQLDGLEVGLGDLGLELGELGEEGAVDNADALEKFVVVGAGDGPGDEDVAVSLVSSFYSLRGMGVGVLDVRNDLDSSLIGKLAQSLESERAADRGDVGERLKDVGVADGVAVIEENHRAHGRLSGHNGRDDVRLGVRDVGREGSRSLLS